MARQKGSANFAGTIEVLAGGPIDARTVVALKSDLTAANTFDYSYEGMQVYCKEDKKTYKLIAEGTTVLAHWEEVGAGATITTDATPTEGSTNAVQSGGVYNALQDKADLENGKIPASQLPSYVDDVIQGYLYNGAFYEDSSHTILITGENGKIYIDLVSNKTYRWNGSGYSEISESLALGETSSTAYRGDRGKIAYDDSQTNKSAIGTLANLVTTAKNNLVVAINEIKNSLSTVATSGSFDDLTNRPSTTIDMSTIITDPPSQTEGIIYSTEERVVGRWIDGSILYQKTVSITTPNSSEYTEISLSMTGIANAFLAEGSYVEITSGSTLQRVPINNIQATTLLQISSSGALSCIVKVTDTNWRNRTAKLTIRYTKTS